MLHTITRSCRNSYKIIENSLPSLLALLLCGEPRHTAGANSTPQILPCCALTHHSEGFLRQAIRTKEIKDENKNQLRTKKNQLRTKKKPPEAKDKTKTLRTKKKTLRTKKNLPFGNPNVTTPQHFTA